MMRVFFDETSPPEYIVESTVAKSARTKPHYELAGVSVARSSKLMRPQMKYELYKMRLYKCIRLRACCKIKAASLGHTASLRAVHGTMALLLLRHRRSTS
jgi:hypothetical protein